MEEYYTIFELPSLDAFLHARSRQLTQALSQIRAEEVQSEPAMLNAVARYKAQFELQPVFFEEPRVVRDEEVFINLAAGQSLLGFRSKAYLVDVEYRFTGSAELIRHAPSNVPFGGGTRVYAPSYGEVVAVTVQVGQLDKAVVIAAAEEKMQATRSLATATATPAREWNARLDLDIQEGLARRKSELDALYG